MKLTKSVVGNQQIICLCKMASDYKFCIEVGYQLHPSVWEDNWSAILYGYIESYTRQYNSNAMPVLKQMAKDRADAIADEDTADATIVYARQIQNYYEEHKDLFANDKYIRDTILKWIKERNLIVLRDRITSAIEDGKLEQA